MRKQALYLLADNRDVVCDVYGRAPKHPRDNESQRRSYGIRWFSPLGSAFCPDLFITTEIKAEQAKGKTGQHGTLKYGSIGQENNERPCHTPGDKGKNRIDSLKISNRKTQSCEK